MNNTNRQGEYILRFLKKQDVFLNMVLSVKGIVFIFDQSSCHRKYGSYALLTRNILVKDGVCRVRVTEWPIGSGNPQAMVLPDLMALQKGWEQ